MRLRDHVQLSMVMRILTISLLGHAGGCTMELEAPVPITAQEAFVVVDHRDFPAASWEHAVRRDRHTGSETYLALFGGPTSVARYLAMKTGPSHVVKEREPKQCAESLLNEEWEVQWGEAGRIRTGLIETKYRQFEIDDGLLNCVAIRGLWGSSRDDRGRRNNQACGFFCRLGPPMSRSVVEDLINHVTIR